MARLTWYNVDAPDFRGASNNVNNAAALLERATQSAQQGLGTVQQAQQDAAARAYQQAQMAYQDHAQLRQALAQDPTLGLQSPHLTAEMLQGGQDRVGTLLSQALQGNTLEQGQYTLGRTQDIDQRNDAAGALIAAYQQQLAQKDLAGASETLADPAIAALGQDNQHQLYDRFNTTRQTLLEQQRQGAKNRENELWRQYELEYGPVINELQEAGLLGDMVRFRQLVQDNPQLRNLPPKMYKEMGVNIQDLLKQDLSHRDNLTDFNTKVRDITKLYQEEQQGEAMALAATELRNAPDAAAAERLVQSLRPYFSPTHYTALEAQVQERFPGAFSDQLTADPDIASQDTATFLQSLPPELLRTFEDTVEGMPQNVLFSAEQASQFVNERLAANIAGSGMSAQYLEAVDDTRNVQEVSLEAAGEGGLLADYPQPVVAQTIRKVQQQAKDKAMPAAVALAMIVENMTHEERLTRDPRSMTIREQSAGQSLPGNAVNRITLDQRALRQDLQAWESGNIRTLSDNHKLLNRDLALLRSAETEYKTALQEYSLLYTQAQSRPGRGASLERYRTKVDQARAKVDRAVNTVRRNEGARPRDKATTPNRIEEIIGDYLWRLNPSR